MKQICINVFIFLLSLFGSNVIAIDNNHSFFDDTSFVVFNKKKISNDKLSLKFSTFEQCGFTENKGQVIGFDGLQHPELKFVFQHGSIQIFLLEKGISYQFTKIYYPEGYSDLIDDKSTRKDLEKLKLMQKQVRTETYRMDMTLVGANPEAVIIPEGKSENHINFYNRDILNVHFYNKITYRNIYPGIDWVIYSKNGEVKYDFIVRPNADPSVIKMKYNYHEELIHNRDGSLSLKNQMGNITEKRPISLQAERAISTNFKLENNIVSFIIGSYNHNLELIIDPAVVWATFCGSTGYDYATSCATDALGNVFISGYTTSTVNFALAGHQTTYGGNLGDSFLAKYNSNGTKLWTTYYGGTGVEYDDRPYCATDGLGNVYLAGTTNSTANIAYFGFQNTNSTGSYDAYLVKFNSNGIRLWATYYGGNSNDNGTTCATDIFGNVYLVGTTNSSSNIAFGGHQNLVGYSAPGASAATNDAFLVKFSSSGTRLWGTYYGGLDDDLGYGCTTDSAGNVYLSGITKSTSNISSGGHQNTIGSTAWNIRDAFLVKFTSNGVRLWGTYYGGTEDETSSSCVTDRSGNVYLCGQTTSSTNIAFGGLQNIKLNGTDAFLAKFNTNGVRLWSTYYGGSHDDDGRSCSVDLDGNVYLTGHTASTVNIADGGHQNICGCWAYLGDAYLVKFNSSGARLWATYYGGSGHDVGTSCATDPWGNIYLAGYTQSGNNVAFNGFQNSYGGGPNDGFLAKFCNGQVLTTGSGTICSGQLFTAIASGANTYSWSNGSTSSTLSVAPTTSSSYTIIGINSLNNCSSTKTIYVNVIPSPSFSITGNKFMCLGKTSTLHINGNDNYYWSNGQTSNSIVIQPTVTCPFSVTAVSPVNNCSTTTIFTVTVFPLPIINAISFYPVICLGENAYLGVAGASTFTWNIGQTGANIIVSPTISTNYTVTGTDTSGCSNSAIITQLVDVCTNVILNKTDNNSCFIYPNPNKGEFIIEVLFQTWITITNELGQIILERQVEKGKTKIDMNKQSPGIYFVNEKSKNSKIIIE